MSMYQKTMFDRYYCIESLCHLKTSWKTLQKVNFCIAIMARLGAQWLSGRVLDSRQKASSALLHCGP